MGIHHYIMLLNKKKLTLWGTLLRNLKWILQNLIRWNFVNYSINCRHTYINNFVTHVCTVQLKGNLMPACLLQLDNLWVKITSCVQYLNGHPFMPTSGKSLGMYTRKCGPHFWTNFLLNLILIAYTEWTYEYCLCMFQSILE